MGSKKERGTGASGTVSVKERTDDVSSGSAGVQYPGKYNVILHNDEYTPADFVVNVVMQVFEDYHGDRMRAAQFVWRVHNDGRGVAGTYVKSIAESKAGIVRKIAEAVHYPLKCSVEKE